MVKPTNACEQINETKHCESLVVVLRESACNRSYRTPCAFCPFLDISPVPDEGCLEGCDWGRKVGMSFSNGMNRLSMAEVKTLRDLVSSH